MNLRTLPAVLATIVLALWVAGVAGWLGTSPAANWVLFLVGVALAAVGPALRPRSSAPAAARP